MKGTFPSLLAQGEGLGRGKGAVCLFGVVFTAGKQTPVGGFVTWCELFSYAYTAAWLVAGKPWCPAGGAQEAFQQEGKMRQWVFKLILCQEVRRPHRKCFCKHGTPSSCTAGTPTCTLQFSFLFFPSQHCMDAWLRFLAGGYSPLQLLQQPPSFGFSPLQSFRFNPTSE